MQKFFENMISFTLHFSILFYNKQTSCMITLFNMNRKYKMRVYYGKKKKKDSCNNYISPIG